MTADELELTRSRPRKSEPLVAKTAKQARYINAIDSQILTFGIGPAGTGKTFIAVSKAAQALQDGDVDRIIITRPIVEAGEELGFLPGDMSEKTGPYMTPLIEVLNKRLGKGYVEYLLKEGKVEVLPLAYMRGRSLERAFIILDEAQNTSPIQMKMFLTRVAEDSKVIVDGDLSQIDIKGPSGLADALDRLRHLPSVAIVRFTREDIVRSGFCQDVVAAYSNDIEEDEPESEDDDAGLHRVLAD